MSEEIRNNAPIALSIDDGSRRYELRNAAGATVGEFTINPADIGILERFSAMQQEADALAQPFDAMEDIDDMGAFVAATAEAKQRLCAAIDRLLGSEGTAEKLFGKVHPFTPVDGRFYFDRVLEAVGDQIAATFETEAAKFGAPEVTKYTSRKGKTAQ